MSVNSPHVQTKLALHKGRKVANVWMLSYECAGIAQAGGLGEAVAGLARTLASDYDLKVTVLLPGHGRQSSLNLRESYNLIEETQFIAHGFRTGVNGVSYEFLSGIETGVHDNVRFVLVKGLDVPTSHWLDSPVLYDHDVTFEKMALFARTVKLYSGYLLSMRRLTELPDLIHAHDWHMVPAGVAVKQNRQERGCPTPLVFTVHLLSHVELPWHYASEDWCGIRDLPHQVRLSKRRTRTLTYRQVWAGECNNSLERFGCYEADYVTSVSESYLARDVLDYAGDVIRWKSGHIYNGCDWDYDSIKSTVLREETRLTKGPDPAKPVNRWGIREFLLTSALGKVSTGVGTEDLADSSPPGSSQTMVEPFRTDGPLVLMTGRLSPQKGADLLLDAVPLVTKTVPTAKFLLFLLPSGDTVQMNEIEEGASAYPDNVRVIFARNRPLYLMSHVAADVYVMPSRSEPFGISALEAMATGNPVVGSNLGGISETVLDIESHGARGTGLLVLPESKNALAGSLISMLLVMQIDEETQRHEKNPVGRIQDIRSKLLMELVRANPTLGSKIRENCRLRVEQNFRWKNAGRVALARYAIARSLTDHYTHRNMKSAQNKP